MAQQKTTYYACWVRWQQAAGLPWQDQPEPAREAIGADANGAAPLFKTQLALAS